MWFPSETSVGEATQMALGFFVETEPQLKVRHSGQQGKASIRLVLYPAAHHGIVVISNLEQLDDSAVYMTIYKALAAAC